MKNRIIRVCVLAVAALALYVGVPVMTASRINAADVHSEQGKFVIKAPTPERAAQVLAECQKAGAVCSLDGLCFIRLTITIDLYQWWDSLQPRLTDCIVSAGAEGHTSAIVSAGAAG